MAWYNINLPTNISGKKIKEKLQGLGITQIEFLRILDNYGIMGISDDTLSKKLNGLEQISDAELLLWSKLLKCPIEELLDDIGIDDNIAQATECISDMINYRNKVAKLKPVVTWKPKMPAIDEKGRCKWSDELREDLVKFYDEFGMDNMLETYQGISKAALLNQITIYRRYHLNPYYQAEINHQQSNEYNFIKYLHKHGIEDTAKRYGIDVEQVKEYKELIPKFMYY